MTQITFRLLITGLGIAAASASAQAPKSQLVAVDNGIASFHVRTNIPALEVSGKSASLKARVRMHRDSDGVKTSNDVSIHLDLSGKEADLMAAAPGRR